MVSKCVQFQVRLQLLGLQPHDCSLTLRYLHLETYPSYITYQKTTVMARFLCRGTEMHGWMLGTTRCTLQSSSNGNCPKACTWKPFQVTIRTERPVRHGSGAADELGVLIHDVERSRAGEEVEVEGAADDAPREEAVAVVEIHAVAVEQHYAVRQAAGAHVQVERVRAVEVHVHIHGAQVRRPQRVGLPLHQRQPVRPRALAQAEQRRVHRHLGRNLQVLVLEHQRVEGGLHGVRDGGRGVKEDLVVGDARHGEAEWAGGVSQLDQGLLREREPVVAAPRRCTRVVAGHQRQRHLPSRRARVRDLRVNSELAFHSATNTQQLWVSR